MFPDPNDRTSTILVVDDEYLLRATLADYLQECGFKVEASSADEAVAILEKTGVDLVLTDVRMPGAMDGFGLARWIRTNRPSMQVILTSGAASKTEAAKQLCENEPFFEKPYKLEAVVAQIRSSLHRSSSL